MRYLSLFTPNGAPMHRLETEALTQEMIRAGKLVATGAFLSNDLGAVVSDVGGNVTVSDSAETSEQAVGFAILEAKSKAEAIEMAKRFLKTTGGGECLLRPLMDAPPQGR